MSHHQVESGDRISLKKIDPERTSPENLERDEGEREFLVLKEKLIHLQEKLFAENRQKILIVLQAMDTGGKDGAIRHVFSGINPQGVRVVSFKAPSPDELAHDYLWRVHSKVPGRGEIVVFNRSHYEDVLVVRVHNLVPEKTWKKRFAHINDFEKMLTDEGITMLKFYLHIDRDEQRKRLQERLDDPAKHWKFNPGDLKERVLWDDYMTAYEEMIERTSTAHAPWFIIPSNRKWYRNLAIARILNHTLESLDMQFPNIPIAPDLRID